MRIITIIILKVYVSLPLQPAGDGRLDWTGSAIDRQGEGGHEREREKSSKKEKEGSLFDRNDCQESPEGGKHERQCIRVGQKNGSLEESMLLPPVHQQQEERDARRRTYILLMTPVLLPSLPCSSSSS